MRKTARTVVWEGAGAQSPAPDPIGRRDARRYRREVHGEVRRTPAEAELLPSAPSCLLMEMQGG